MGKKIKVIKLTDTSIQVGKKVVYLDSNDNWVAISELTVREKDAFENYKAEVLDVLG